MDDAKRMNRSRHTIASRRRRFYPKRQNKDADVILFDSFTDTNGTALDSHTPDRNSPGNSYVISGALQVQSNKLENRAIAGVWANGLIDLDTANVDISADLNCGDPATASYICLAFRSLDSNNLWRSMYNSADQVIRLQEVDGGVLTNRASESITLDPNTDYSMRLLVYGDYIKAVAHDGTTITYSSSLHAGNTKHGIMTIYIGAISTTYQSYDNLKIKRGLAQ